MNPDTDNRITTEHRSREAVVYVRQSSPDQVRSNVESRRIQLGLREKAIAQGWSRPTVIDEDLGISAAGYAHRPGFQQLLARVVLREIGIILCVDASRLSRNSKERRRIDVIVFAVSVSWFLSLLNRTDTKNRSCKCRKKTEEKYKPEELLDN